MSLITWIEDLPSYVHEIVEEFLEQGHTVDIIKTANGLMGVIDTVIEHSDLVILDLWLPLGSGTAVSKKLGPSSRGIWLYEQLRTARAKSGRDVDIILLSGNLDNDVITELKECGAVAGELWKKPVGEEFVSDVEARLKKTGENEDSE